jgi:uncharacterized protein YjbI with pentapeptide repeats
LKSISRPKIQPPQIPKHLPAGGLDALEDYGEYSSLSLSGINLALPKVTNSSFERIHFRRVVFGPSQHVKLRFIDCRIESSDLSGIAWDQARFRRVEFLGCRLIGAQFLGAELEDVVFKDCSLGNAVFSLARFKAARFENCMLTQASFESADCSGVVFADCDLSQADLRQAKLGATDLRGSRLGGVQVGAPELKGAVIDSAQAIQIASLIGLIVREKGEDLDEQAPELRGDGRPN